MNEDTKRARERMRSGGHTCVLSRDGRFYVSDQKGIAPMMGFLAKKTDLRGFSLADRVVGRAAAMLFVLAGVREVWAEVISRGAVNVLNDHGIAVEYGSLTERIINRTKDGFCPMESAVMEIDDPREGYEILAQKMQEMKNMGKERPH